MTSPSSAWQPVCLNSMFNSSLVTGRYIRTISSSMTTALILLADGTEEMEFTITYDVLVRGGLICTSALVTTPQPEISSGDKTLPLATCSRGVKIVADKFFGDLKSTEEFSLIVVPGGAKGAETISSNEHVLQMIRNQYSSGRLVGMICAGSLAAKEAQIGHGGRITSHPSVKDALFHDYIYLEEGVVQEKNLVTSRGPGTAFPFALRLVEIMQGVDKRTEIYSPMVFS